MDRSIDRNTEGNAEYQDRGCFDRDTEISHDGSRDDLWYDVGNQGNQNHTLAFEHPSHKESDENNS